MESDERPPRRHCRVRSFLGLSTGAATGASASQSSARPVEAETPARRSPRRSPNTRASRNDDAAVVCSSFSKVVRDAAAPGGSLEDRINGDEGQVREMKERVATMSQMLLVRQKALEQTYSELEAVISRNSAQSSGSRARRPSSKRRLAPGLNLLAAAPIYTRSRSTCRHLRRPTVERRSWAPRGDRRGDAVRRRAPVPAPGRRWMRAREVARATSRCAAPS